MMLPATPRALAAQNVMGVQMKATLPIATRDILSKRMRRNRCEQSEVLSSLLGQFGGSDQLHRLSGELSELEHELEALDSQSRLVGPVTPHRKPMIEIALADPSRIRPFDKDGTLQVVIETPQGSRNKYAFDHERNVIVLKKILPAGMIFPYNFGLVPSTLAEDGDPLDVLVLMEEAAFPGCVLDARIIDVIEGEDELDGGATQRNDRLLAVATMSQTYEDVHSVDRPILGRRWAM